MPGNATVPYSLPNKNPAADPDLPQGRYQPWFHPVCLNDSFRPLFADCNGVTGPDWGRSEVVFRWIRRRDFPASVPSLSGFLILLFSSTLYMSMIQFFLRFCAGRPAASVDASYPQTVCPVNRKLPACPDTCSLLTDHTFLPPEGETVFQDIFMCDTAGQEGCFITFFLNLLQGIFNRVLQPFFVIQQIKHLEFQNGGWFPVSSGIPPFCRHPVSIFH